VGTWATTCLVITTNVGLNDACPNNRSDQEFKAVCESIYCTVLSVTVDVLQTHEAAQISDHETVFLTCKGALL